MKPRYQTKEGKAWKKQRQLDNPEKIKEYNKALAFENAVELRQHQRGDTNKLLSVLYQQDVQLSPGAKRFPPA